MGHSERERERKTEKTERMFYHMDYFFFLNNLFFFLYLTVDNKKAPTSVHTDVVPAEMKEEIARLRIENRRLKGGGDSSSSDRRIDEVEDELDTQKRLCSSYIKKLRQKEETVQVFFFVFLFLIPSPSLFAFCSFLCLPFLIVRFFLIIIKSGRNFKEQTH